MFELQLLPICCTKIISDFKSTHQNMLIGNQLLALLLLASQVAAQARYYNLTLSYSLTTCDHCVNFKYNCREICSPSSEDAIPFVNVCYLNHGTTDQYTESCQCRGDDITSLIDSDSSENPACLSPSGSAETTYSLPEASTVTVLTTVVVNVCTSPAAQGSGPSSVDPPSYTVSSGAIGSGESSVEVPSPTPCKSSSTTTTEQGSGSTSLVLPSYSYTSEVVGSGGSSVAIPSPSKTRRRSRTRKTRTHSCTTSSSAFGSGNTDISVPVENDCVYSPSTSCDHCEYWKHNCRQFCCPSSTDDISFVNICYPTYGTIDQYTKSCQCRGDDITSLVDQNSSENPDCQPPQSTTSSAFGSGNTDVPIPSISDTCTESASEVGSGQTTVAIPSSSSVPATPTCKTEASGSGNTDVSLPSLTSPLSRHHSKSRHHHLKSSSADYGSGNTDVSIPSSTVCITLTSTILGSGNSDFSVPTDAPSYILHRSRHHYWNHSTELNYYSFPTSEAEGSAQTSLVAPPSFATSTACDYCGRFKKACRVYCRNVSKGADFALVNQCYNEFSSCVCNGVDLSIGIESEVDEQAPEEQTC